jgi:hypothetical protein
MGSGQVALVDRQPSEGFIADVASERLAWDLGASRRGLGPRSATPAGRTGRPLDALARIRPLVVSKLPTEQWRDSRLRLQS